MTAKFCNNCGQPLEAGTKFCTLCGKPLQEPVHFPAAAASPAQRAVPTQTMSKRKSVWIGVVIGILLIVLGIRMPMAMLFGEQTGARIDSVDRRIDRNSDNMDYRYVIRYRFTASDEKLITGSYTMTNVYNQSTLPAVNSIIQIKYVPGLSFINAPVSQSNFGLGSVLLIALGIFLMILGIRGNLTVGRVRRR